jgi:CubicO group peptidase (beta-lactamase class C family)
MSERRIPGVSIAIIKNNKIIKQKVYGTANLEQNVLATPQTVFQLASITKTFTGVAIMRLAEAGKLSLDQKIDTLLPAIPSSWKGVTVRQLLNHTSGIPDVFSDANAGTYLADNRDDLVNKLFVLPVVSPPGETWAYEAAGYLLLGMIIEKVSGLTFEEFIVQQLFRPLGITSATFGDYKEIVKNRATYYREEDAVMRHYWYRFPTFLHTAAGLNITATDLAKWDIALSTGKIINPSSIREMYTPAKLNNGQTHDYGYGWEIHNRPHHSSVGHSGGRSSAYERFLEDKLTVIVLTNLSGADPDALAEGIAAIYIPAFRGETK